MHICVGKLTTIGSDNDLLPGWRQAIIWTSAGILLIEPSGTKFSEILMAGTSQTTLSNVFSSSKYLDLDLSFTEVCSYEPH